MQDDTPQPHVTNERAPFAQVPEALLYDASVSPNAVRVYGCLQRHGDSPENCYPSHRRIASFLNLSERSIPRLIDELEAGGWVTRVKRPPLVDGTRRPDAYFVRLRPRRIARSTAQQSAEPPRDPARSHRAAERGERESVEREPSNEHLADRAAERVEPPVDVLRESCKRLAEREADGMADSINNRSGWVKARTNSLVKEHAAEVQRVLAEWPDTKPDMLARYLLGEKSAVGDRIFLPGTGWIKKAS